MNREFLKFYNQELAILREQAAEFAQEYPGIAERLGGLLDDNARSDDRRAARGRGVPGRAGPAQAQARIRRLHHQPDRPTGAALSRARRRPSCSFRQSPNSAIRRCARAGRSREAPFSTRHTARRSATSPAGSRLPTPITLWPFDIVKAEYLTSPGGVAGADPKRRRRLRRVPATATHRARAAQTRRRAGRQGGAGPAGAAIFVLPGEVAALSSARPGNRRCRAVRAAVRALPRRLFSRARLVRRSDRRRRDAPT